MGPAHPFLTPRHPTPPRYSYIRGVLSGRVLFQGAALDLSLHGTMRLCVVTAISSASTIIPNAATAPAIAAVAPGSGGGGGGGGGGDGGGGGGGGGGVTLASAARSGSGAWESNSGQQGGESGSCLVSTAPLRMTPVTRITVRFDAAASPLQPARASVPFSPATPLSAALAAGRPPGNSTPAVTPWRAAPPKASAAAAAAAGNLGASSPAAGSPAASTPATSTPAATAAAATSPPCSSTVKSVDAACPSLAQTTPTHPRGFASVGGLAGPIQIIRDMLSLSLDSPQLFTSLGLRPPRGVLLYGPPGSGKTLLARAVAAECGAAFFAINGAEVVGRYLGESEARLRAVFAQAAAQSPAVIFIDEVDALCPARGESSDELEKRVVATLLTEMDGLASSVPTLATMMQSGAAPRVAEPGGGLGGRLTRNDRGDGNVRIVVLAATNRPNALDPALRRPGRFDREVEIGVPSAAGREDILRIMLARVPHAISCEELQRVADAAHGFVGADLQSVVQEAGFSALRRALPATGWGVGAGESVSVSGEHSSAASATATAAAAPAAAAAAAAPADGSLFHLEVLPADLWAALKRTRPSALREVALDVPRVLWTDVGGQAGAKAALQEAVEWPLKYPEAFARMNIRPPLGILLYGPPGCSKTLMAKAIATEGGMNFIAVKGPELFSKWVGESEKAVKEVFRKARASAPTVVFFDEIDALAVRRGGDEGAGGVSDRVLSQLLTEMDGIDPLRRVVVVAATNRPDMLDPALLRPGRIDRRLFVAPPDELARAEILRIHLRAVACSAGVDAARIAAETPGFSGAELAALCREAALCAMEEDLDAPCIEHRHFDAARLRVLPQITSAMLAYYARFERKEIS
jgi:AAA family ATPase